uniref:Uncharacterized protein n=1 Tax=Caenorhabditis tropicalis TaxID=1561998 RepID=A0A1I7TEI2_9PELO
MVETVKTRGINWERSIIASFLSSVIDILKGFPILDSLLISFLLREEDPKQLMRRSVDISSARIPFRFNIPSEATFFVFSLIVSTTRHMSIKILFEQIEQSTHHILTDCDLQSVTIRKEEHGLKEEKKKVLYRDEGVGTDVETEHKCVGPSILKVNVATKYEFQKLNATQN